MDMYTNVRKSISLSLLEILATTEIVPLVKLITESLGKRKQKRRL
jgi:hypothetical protein